MTDAELAAIEERFNARLPVTDAEGSCIACGARPGEMHDEGCDMERCPHCGEQTIVCGNCQDETASDAFPALLAALRELRAAARAVVGRAEVYIKGGLYDPATECALCQCGWHDHDRDCPIPALVALVEEP